MSNAKPPLPLTRVFAPRSVPMRVPRPVAEQPGMVLADATWGTIQPITLARGVRTVGELEVIAHLQEPFALIDTRAPESFREATIPAARNIPHTEAALSVAELDSAPPTCFFCNGPQCPATPDAVRALLTAGYPADAVLFYRGGLHDWVRLHAGKAGDPRAGPCLRSVQPGSPERKGRAIIGARCAAAVEPLLSASSGGCANGRGGAGGSGGVG
jgi:rhodanese-related sulfurtransferase